jgi:hypothetical protein
MVAFAPIIPFRCARHSLALLYGSCGTWGVGGKRVCAIMPQQAARTNRPLVGIR